MAIIRKRDLKGMNPEQIEEKIKELGTEYSKMKSQVRSGGAPENSGRMGEIRRTIARLETAKTQHSRQKPTEVEPAKKSAEPAKKLAKAVK